MLLSCKISYSAIVYSEHQGAQWRSFFEKHRYPIEFLKDPSYWLESEQLESFLADFADHLGIDDPHSYYREVGRSNSQLRAWGVLDSVLKMVASPLDIFSQPERFLSYFVSPPPAVKVLESHDERVVFQWGFAKDTYPLANVYIRGAMEGLPQYMTLPLAEIEDDESGRWVLTWSNDQQSLFGESEQNHRQLHPEIVQSVMDSLQEQQKKHTVGATRGDEAAPVFDARQLEDHIQREVQKRIHDWSEKKDHFEATLFQLKNDFYKLYDYFTRAQQLITLIGSSAKKAQAKEAMRRVDWPYVQKEFPKMVEGACEALMSLREVVGEWENPVLPSIEAQKRPVDLNDLIDGIIENLSLGSRQLKIDRHWLLDKPVPVFADGLSRAIKEVLDTSVAKSRSGDEVRVVTRPNGRKVEIEITDTGSGYDEETLMKVFSEESENGLSETQKIIREHNGNISISSRVGQGATFLIELPL